MPPPSRDEPADPGRLVLLSTSRRLPAGILTRDAWVAVTDAALVLAADGEDPQVRALRDAGVDVELVDDRGPHGVAPRLVAAVPAASSLVWVTSPDGDPGLTEALATEVAGLARAPVVQVLLGSWDPPGARVLDAVETMDRLRAPGGCPWDAEQTHASLLPYLLEEAHELVEAVEDPAPGPHGRAHLVEELGDVLLQVLFHARIAAEDEHAPFDVDDVAAALVAKLVHRHPHVFAPGDEGAAARDAAEVEARWEDLKAREKPERAHVLDGIPTSMPDLARTVKVLTRADRAGLGPALADWLAGWPRPHDPADAAAAAIVTELTQARDRGGDPVAALRRLLRDLHSHLAPDSIPRGS